MITAGQLRASRALIGIDQRILAESADVLLTNARHLDVGLQEVIGLLRERDAAMQPESSQ